MRSLITTSANKYFFNKLNKKKLKSIGKWIGQNLIITGKTDY